MTSSHAVEDTVLLLKVNVVEHLEGKRVVAEEHMHPQQTDDAKVAQHLVQRAGAKLAGDLIRVLALILSRKLLNNLGLLDERVEHIKYAVAAPDAAILQQLKVVLVLVVNLVPPLRVRLVLVNKLVNDVPEPLYGKLERNRAIRV